MLTEREIRQLNRQYVKAIREFTDLTNEVDWFEEAKNSVIEIDRMYAHLNMTFNKYKEFLNLENDLEEIEDIGEKKELISQQLQIARSTLADMEEKHHQQSVKLVQDLIQTSKKNSVQSSITNRSIRSNDSKLFAYDKLSPEEKVMVAESMLEAAAIEIELAKRLAAARESTRNNLSARDAPSKSNMTGTTTTACTSKRDAQMLDGGSIENNVNNLNSFSQSKMNDATLLAKSS